ncbi:phosphatidylinositol-specific phospholipase C domain-containing protein [Bacillus thuringiensis]|uniref:phosphatidylinositol-specific phospholipase C domain-containing protein n=1 Tax=Bacillus thuringiensis TaxID=1428 RepID=UPI002AB526CA|nr:phosphatidylinositol-specific phospholipase C domain-containing protein [Bacillus thuringiensis]MDY7965670.1 phosphatidylinositol-specific phospholipase C domain-containing protein [Bacillus thuringiensis]
MRKNQQQISNFDRSDLIGECNRYKRVNVKDIFDPCQRFWEPGFSDCPTTPTKSRPMNLYTWMKDISDNTRLSNLSIPGTHDSMATRATMPTTPPFTETHTLSLWNQLSTGIRFLDIRLKYENGALACYHGIVWLGKYFDYVLQQIKRYLETYPSETIYMRIAQENSNAPVTDFVSSVRNSTDHYANGLRYTGGAINNQNPTLAQTRGKFVILLDIPGYSYSTHGSTGINYRSSNRQDAYETKGDAKVELVTNHLHAANNRGSSNSTIYINYLSANLGRYVDLTGTPLIIARYVNPRIYDYLINQNFNYVGIVVADYPGWGLISEIINQNFERFLIVNGVFQIVTALNNSSVLDVNPNHNVTLWSNNGGNHQKWEFIHYSGEIHLIRNIGYPNLYLSVNFANVIAATRNNIHHWAQWWKMERFQDGYRIIHFDSNYVLDVASDETKNGTNIIVYNNHPLNTKSRNQTFFIR